MLSPEKFSLYAASPAAFRDDLIVEVDGQPVRFGDRMASFQKADFGNCDGGFMRCAGIPVEGTPSMRAYLERPRGHSKSTDIAVMVAWTLAFARQIVTGYVFAADKEQARLVRDSIRTLLRMNDLLASILDAQKDRILNVAEKHPGRDSSLDVMASDVGSSYGLLPSFIICEETTNWQGDGSLWHSVISSVAKRNSAMLVCLGNAGRNRGNCWQWDLRALAQNSPLWYFNSLPGPDRAFLSQQRDDELRLALPGFAYSRLVLNKWSDAGDALDSADITACITQAGPMHGGEPGWKFVAGLDLSSKRDHSALVVLASHFEMQRLRVASCESWAPRPGGTVDLDAVKSAIIAAHKKFKLKKVVFDPWQAELLKQQASREAGIVFEEMTFSSGNCTRMANAILELFRSRQIDLWNEPRLISDLSRLNIVEKAAGWKLEADRTASTGHADRAIALAICAPAALEELRRRKTFACAIATRECDEPGPGERSRKWW
jgi:phage terminase large subunit-like protein